MFTLFICYHFTVQRSALPMLQLLLFAALLFLPFNTTPLFIVWSYQKILRLSESAFLLIEAVVAVLVVMYVSQSIVNEIDEHPIIVKVQVIILLN